jgi:hypothetical protein
MPFLKRVYSTADLTGDYYYLNNKGSISKTTAKNKPVDLKRFNNNNFFRTLGEALQTYGRTDTKTNSIPEILS